jgi:hypothetical protein
MRRHCSYRGLGCFRWYRNPIGKAREKATSIKKPPRVAAVFFSESTAALTALAVATAAAASVVTAATTTPATGAFLTRPSFVDGEGSALEVLLMEHLHSLVCFGLRAHFHECESPGASRSAILHDVDRNDGASLREVVLEVVFGGVIREVTYE